jgi:hypothetical protein
VKVTLVGDAITASDGTIASRPEGGASAASAPSPEPVADELAACKLTGQRRQLSGVVAADVVATKRGPVVVAIVERPRAEPLAMQGEKGFPPLRALYVISPTDGDEGTGVTNLFDDPGPLHDPFDRRAYERLAATAATCDSAGCMVALSIERQTPGMPSAAFSTVVQMLDDAVEVQGEPRWLAQEPDRGDRLSLCVGAASEGFLVATAVAGGRGRLLWLDRRGTPLLHRFLTEGFDLCSIWPAGLAMEVATQHAGGIELNEMGGQPQPDSGPGPWRPTLSETSRLPALTSSGAELLLFWADAQGSHMSASTREDTVSLQGDEVIWQHAASTDGGVLLAFTEKRGGQVGVVRLDAELAPVARGRGLAKAQRVWALGRAGSSETWLAWQEGDLLEVSPLSCPAVDDALPASEEATPLTKVAALDRADRVAVGRLRQRARIARSRDEDYRAAWLMERAYRLDPSDHESMVDAAGLLIGIRFTKAALRILEQMSKLESSEARTALRSSCRDRDFRRMWKRIEFQRITGCSAPPEATTPDAGVAETDESAEMDE